ncbi:uncharacterized protein LOC134338846 [Mobula hypostoma]|uniref:uncharacterized protein LOC134338846 n=1 Tax=Mobula hypostoma TaxID=723540 RepID=UPI002FC347BD
MELAGHLLVILQLIFVWLSTSVLVEDNVIREKNITYSSNCWLDFKYYNISCSLINLSINGTTVVQDNSFILPITNFSTSEGFKVDDCQTVLVRCYKNGIETHYVAQGTEDTKSNNVKEEDGDSNRYWIGVVVSVLVCLFLVCLLALAGYYRKLHCRDKHILPLCCESQMKDPIEDPAAKRNLCESQETLQSEQLMDKTPNSR